MMDKQFDVEAFKRFVASKPADQTYNGCAPKACALAQFGFPDVGIEEARVLGLTEEQYFSIVDGPCTFGALGERLSRLPVSTPVERRSASTPEGERP